MSNLVDGVLHLSPFWLLTVAALLVFAEDAIFVGFFIPGETAAVLAGVATAVGDVPLAAAIVVIVLAAIVGDSVGYEVGRRWLSRLLQLRIVDRHRERVDRAQDLLVRRGGIAILIGRSTAVLRAVVPALAGAARMPYRTFLVWNAAGGILWGTAFVLLGHAAGASYHVVEKQVGRGVAVALAVVVVGLLVVWRVRAHRDDGR